MNTFSCFALGLCLVLTVSAQTPNQTPEQAETAPILEGVQLGNFSVSLSVENLEASIAFYEKLGFTQVGGVLKQNWIIMQNDTTTVGLFHGMFEGNIMTFNPGWDKDKNTLKDFTDVRVLQSELKKRGIEFVSEADPNSTGPASLILIDPDGNTIFIDQHVEAPKEENDVKTYR